MVRTPSYLPTTPWIEQAQRYGIPLSNTGKLLHAAMPNRMKVSTSQSKEAVSPKFTRLIGVNSNRQVVSNGLR